MAKHSRGGLPKLFFENLNFEKYAEFVMKFPILFIQHEDKYISGSNYTFNDFMNGKINEIENRLPTENDLTIHLSTIFTENRLKKYIELRSMDTCGWDCLCSCLLYTSPSPRDRSISRMPSSA